LNINQSNAFVCVPDSIGTEDALSRTTHLAIGAHPDDLELIGIHGIAACFDRKDKWFTGVIVTDGAGSVRGGSYAAMSDAEIRGVRQQEQVTAAHLGQFSAAVQLGYPSSVLLAGFDEGLIQTLSDILTRAQPETVYLHNPADRHATHVAVCVHTIEALRRSNHLPKEVFGVEVWRSLDWVSSEARILLDVSEVDALQQRLLNIYKSQLEGGKRLDAAIRARNIANATFDSEREADAILYGSYALDLLPLVCDTDLTVAGYVESLVDGIKIEIDTNLQNFRDN
jgi:LmbE family N-acetylglucosaminyl deacetylase